MLAVTLQEVGLHDTDLAQEIGNHGQLEHQSHDERQGGKGADVGMQRDVAFHHVGNAVGAQETEGDREEDEV